MTKEVIFEPVDGPINDRIDDAYRAKHHGSTYLSPMIGARARSATVQQGTSRTLHRLRAHQAPFSVCTIHHARSARGERHVRAWRSDGMAHSSIRPDLYCFMNYRCIWRSSVPVFRSRWHPDDITF